MLLLLPFETTPGLSNTESDWHTAVLYPSTTQRLAPGTCYEYCRLFSCP